MEPKHLKQFYKITLQERVERLRDAEAVSADDFNTLKNNLLKLPPLIADQMIENYIVNYELPFGVAMNFRINDQQTLIPMVTEEPSVIAAASNAGKIVGKAGGFQTEMDERLMIGQIILKNVTDSKQASENIHEHEDKIIELAHAAYPSLLKYGGGVRRIEVRIIQADEVYETPEFVALHLYVDTAEAMGANIVNTMAEAVAPYVVELTDGATLMSVLSNYATESLVTASCSIAPDLLATEELEGTEVRDRIIEANQLALVDPYRAVTHNKGIMNGIDSVLVATGNDWRAVEASAHAYAAESGQYRALTSWTKDEEGNLEGKIRLPLSVGAVGGTSSIHPTARFAYRLLGEPNTKELSGILAAVGLGQNFAAMRALVTDGIQKGHMNLHARALAIQVGADGDAVELVATRLQEAEHMNSETAYQILEEVMTENS